MARGAVPARESGEGRGGAHPRVHSGVAGGRRGLWRNPPVGMLVVVVLVVDVAWAGAWGGVGLGATERLHMGAVG